MSASWTSFFYLVSAVLFILALRGLSGPRTARTGNQLGMAGMAIAVGVTLFQRGMSGSGFALIVLAIAIGGSAGVLVAPRCRSLWRRSTRWWASPPCSSPPRR